MINTTQALLEELARHGITVEHVGFPPVQVIHGDAALAEQIAAAWVEPPHPVPESITQAQMRSWLYTNLGIVDADVRAIIDGMSNPDRELALIEWEYAPVIHRGHPLVASLGAALGLDAAGLDQAFREAAV